MLNAQPEKKEYKLPYGYEDICHFIPHRPPFLLVDKVLTIEAGKCIHGIKCVSSLEPFFPGHFPAYPVYPGVLIIEGFAQTGAILHFHTLAEAGQDTNRSCLFTGIEEVKFRKQVRPGDVINYYVEVVKIRGNFVWFTATAKVDGELAAEAKFSAMVGGKTEKKS